MTTKDTYEYEDIRPALRDGMLVFVEAHKWFHKLVNLITRGKFVHVGILVWMEDAYGRKKLMCVESYQGGARLVNLRAYVPYKITIVDVNLDWQKNGSTPIEETGILHYNYVNYVLIGIKNLLMQAKAYRLAKMIKPQGSGEVCSEFVGTILEEAGYDVDPFDSPNGLFDQLITLKEYQGAYNVLPTKSIG